MTFEQWKDEVSKSVSLSGNQGSMIHLTVYDDLSGDADEETSMSDGEKESPHALPSAPHSLLKKPLGQTPLSK